MGHGQIIHVSEFINSVSGQLVHCNEQGEIIQEVCKVIYPGSSNDAWWDTDQLIVQVCNEAIPTFEVAHPNCQGLFVFDQSSAHASLTPDALHAWEMNKGNGGKQCIQKDTVIPMNNAAEAL